MVAPSSKTILWVGMWLSWLSVGFSMLLMQIWLPAVASFFLSHSQLSVQTLTILVWSHVQLQVLTSLCMIKKTKHW